MPTFAPTVLKATSGQFWPFGVAGRRLVEGRLMAISRHSDGWTNTSALPPKADINGYDAGCLLLTQSGHWLSRSCQPFLSHIPRG